MKKVDCCVWRTTLTGYMDSCRTILTRRRTAADDPRLKHNAILPLHAASRFNFASHVPLHSSASYADVASASGLRERDATRLLRHAVARDVFTETSDGRISHNAVSRLLREDKPAAEWLAFMAEDMWGASVKTVDALQQFGLAGEEPHPGRTVCALDGECARWKD